MKLKDARENYYSFSGKVSDIIRNLGFVGIAIIWIFKYNNDNKIAVPEPLIPIAFIIILGLVSDLCHRDREISNLLRDGCRLAAPQSQAVK